MLGQLYIDDLIASSSHASSLKTQVIDKQTNSERELFGFTMYSATRGVKPAKGSGSYWRYTKPILVTTGQNNPASEILFPPQNVFENADPGSLLIFVTSTPGEETGVIDLTEDAQPLAKKSRASSASSERVNDEENNQYPRNLSVEGKQEQDVGLGSQSL
jgi:hypothetical protein